MKRQPTYKPFDEKYVIMEFIGNSADIVSFIEGKHQNRVPQFFDLYEDAIKEQVEHLKDIKEAVRRNDMPKDRIADTKNQFIAKASLTNTGHLKIWMNNQSQEILYDGHIIHTIQ